MLVQREKLLGKWRHAFEEDTDGTMVLRRIGGNQAPLPRSRRPRDGFDLEEDGTAVRWGASPSDALTAQGFVWEFDGTELILRSQVDSTSCERFVVVCLAALELRLRRS
jgi:hypothetical protein